MSRAPAAVPPPAYPAAASLDDTEDDEEEEEEAENDGDGDVPSTDPQTAAAVQYAAAQAAAATASAQAAFHQHKLAQMIEQAQHAYPMVAAEASSAAAIHAAAMNVTAAAAAPPAMSTVFTGAAEPKRKGKWAAEQDQRLREAVALHGGKNWFVHTSNQQDARALCTLSLPRCSFVFA